MIEWLRRATPDSPFIFAGDEVWTYRQTLAEVETRLAERPRLITPSLRPEAIFDVIAGISGGGITVVGPAPQVDEPAPADLVVFTSGTSGRPKGVRLTRGNVEAAASASAEHLGHEREDNWLLAMPLHHVGGLSIVFRQLYTGGSVTLLPGFEPDAVDRALRGRVTMVSVVPTMLRRLLDLRPSPYSGIRAVLVGGGPIPDGLLEEADEACLPVLPTYGMTETFGQVATLRPGAPLARHAHPLPGVDLSITKDGRIAVRGAQVSRGYLGEPDRETDWFTTPDLGIIDDEGALQVLGRADRVIVTGGVNVDPARVEEVIARHPGVDAVVVVGISDEVWGSAVACVYTGEVEPDALAVWSAELLVGALKPKRWRRVESIPVLSIGKPDRLAAAELL